MTSKVKHLAFTAHQDCELVAIAISNNETINEKQSMGFCMRMVQMYDGTALAGFS